MTLHDCVIIFVFLILSNPQLGRAEVQLSTNLGNAKQAADITSLHDGQMFAVVWSSVDQDGDGSGVYGIVTTGTGVPLISEFLISETTAGDQRVPRVAALTNNNFAVSWKSGTQIYTRLFNTGGVALTPEIWVTRRTQSESNNPFITAMKSNGGFVVLYDSELGTAGVIFDHSGTEVRSFEGERSCSYPTATALPEGGFAVLCSEFFDLTLNYYDALGLKSSGPINVASLSDTVEYGSICTRDDGKLGFAYSSWHSEEGAPTIHYGTVSTSQVVGNTAVKPVVTEDYNPIMLCTSTHSLVFLHSGSTRVTKWTRNDFGPGTAVDRDFAGFGLIGATRITSQTSSYAVAYPSTDGGVYLAINDGASEVVTTAPNTLTPSTEVPSLSQNEFSVSDVIKGRQESPSIATLDNGDIIVVWQSQQYDGSGFGIVGQLFDSNFNQINSPFLINENTVGDQTNPHVSATTAGYVVVWQSIFISGVRVQARVHLPNGFTSEVHVNDGYSTKYDAMPVVVGGISGYVVVWQSYGRDGSYSGIYARRMGSVATWLVNTATSSSQQRPAIAKLDNGFIITWESLSQQVGGTRFSIFGKVYDNDCLPTSDEFLVSTNVDYSQKQSFITPIPGNGFYVSWTSNGQDGSGSGVYSQEFDSSNTKIGEEFRINSNTVGNQKRPQVVLLSDGTLLASYESNIKDGTDYNIMYRKIKRAGGQVEEFGPEMTLNNYKHFKQFGNVLVGFDWGFVVAYTSNWQDTFRTGVYCYKKEIVFPSSPFLLKSTETEDQRDSSVAILSDESIVVVYTSSSVDRSVESVSFQIFDTRGTIISDVVVSLDARLGKVASSGDGFFYIIFNKKSTREVLTSKYDNTGNSIWSSQLINSVNVNKEIRSGIAADGSKMYAVIGGVDTIYYSMLDSSGSEIISQDPLEIDSFSTDDNPSIAVIAFGVQVAVYHVRDKDGDGYGVYGAVRSAGGIQNDFFHISVDHISGDQMNPDILALADGGYAVAYVSSGQVVIKKYDQFHNVVLMAGQTSTVLTAVGQFGSHPKISETGSIITVLWHSLDNQNTGIIGQRITPSGLYDSQFQVSGSDSLDSNPSFVANSGHVLYVAFTRFDETTLKYRIGLMSYSGNVPLIF